MDKVKVLTVCVDVTVRFLHLLFLFCPTVRLDASVKFHVNALSFCFVITPVTHFLKDATQASGFTTCNAL